MAYTDYLDTVQKVYIAYYQRPADPAGLVYWASELDAVGGNLDAIIDAFANSAESQALYGTINSSSIGDVIDDIYLALFDREPDEAGKQFYIDEFDAGNLSAGAIALAILNGALNEDLDAVNNKLTASKSFTSILDPDGDGAGPFDAT